jgi:hypothetical protein
VSARGALLLATVVVVAATGHTAGASEAVAAAGAETVGAADGLVEALVPPSSLKALAADATVADVRPPARPFPEAVDEGVAATNADAWQAAGYGGAGVRIAIVDLGFYGYQGLLGTSLPASVTAIDHCAGTCRRRRRSAAASTAPRSPSSSTRWRPPRSCT